MKNAWFLGYRIREDMKETRDLFTPPMGGAGLIVEGDETYIGRKGSSKAFQPPRPWRSLNAAGGRLITDPRQLEVALREGTGLSDPDEKGDA